MNLTHPNLRSIDPPDGPDYLAGAVLQGLARPIGRTKSWSGFQTALRAIVSFGLLPIVELPKRFREFVTMEQQQLWHLAEWLRLHSDHPDAPRLREDADALAPRSDTQIFVGLVTAFVAVIFATQLREISLSHAYGGHWFSALLDSTWLYVAHHPGLSSTSRSIAPVLAFKLVLVWTIGLFAGYMAYWRQVTSHAKAVGTFVERFNRIAQAEELLPVPRCAAQSAGSLVWVLVGAALTFAGAVWAIPMMLGAAAQRAYVIRTSVETRAAMAHRLRAMLLRRRPSMNVPMPVQIRRSCKNELCRAAAPGHATFCPRCGKRLAPPLHLLA